MADKVNPSTAAANGEYWGARARDWARFQEGTLRPVFQAALERSGVGPTTRFLDIGCGAGMAAAMAIDMGAQVSGLDASAAMLEIARERSPQGNFKQGDMEALPFEDHHFHVTIAVNALQYAGNPHIALAEACRVTRPGGKMVIVTWGSADGMEATRLNASLQPLLPPPPADAPVPFALSDENELKAFARNAGLEPLEVFEVNAPWTYPDEATAIRAVTSPGVVVRAMGILGEEVVTETYRKTIAQFRLQDGSYSVGANFRGLLARRN